MRPCTAGQQNEPDVAALPAVVDLNPLSLALMTRDQADWTEQALGGRGLYNSSFGTRPTPGSGELPFPCLQSKPT